MTQVLARRLLVALFATVAVFVVFVLAYLALLVVVGLLVVSYFHSIDPNWDAGPGGIIMLPIFFMVLPFAIWLTVLAVKRAMGPLSTRFEVFQTKQFAADVTLLVLIVGLIGISIPYVKGLVSAYLYGKGFGG